MFCPLFSLPNPKEGLTSDRSVAGTVGYLVMPSRSPRDGFHSVTPRIVVEDVEAQVNFLRAVFGATGSVEPGRPAEIRIGNSLVMVSGAVERDRFQGFLYVYVDDADTTYRRALDAGALSVEETTASEGSSTESAPASRALR